MSIIMGCKGMAANVLLRSLERLFMRVWMSFHKVKTMSFYARFLRDKKWENERDEWRKIVLCWLVLSYYWILFLGQISFRELKYLCFLLVVFRFHNFSYLDKIVKRGLSFFVWVSLFAFQKLFRFWTSVFYFFVINYLWLYLSISILSPQLWLGVVEGRCSYVQNRW